MAEPEETDVCVAGGGPAGLLLGLELAKRGRRVTVVEQKNGFERSFRGEAISPDAVWLLDRLGLLDRLREESLVTRRVEIRDAGKVVLSTDFSTAAWPSKYPREIPQPPLLSAIHEQAVALPGFRLLSGRTVTDLLRDDGGRVIGVRCAGEQDGPAQVRAALTVAADGRYSKLREMAALAAAKVPLERDFIWFKVPRPDFWDGQAYQVRLLRGAHGVFIPTVPDQLRVGLNILKGELRTLRSQGIGALHTRVAELAPELAETVHTYLPDWSGTSALEIFSTTVPAWSAPGLVLIGDAAHTLTPILGLGVHHALLDAVVLAPLVADAFNAADVAQALDAASREFQRRREPSVEFSRGLQLRQEKAFALSSPVAVAARRSVYRVINRSDRVRRRLMTGIYYSLQHAVLSGGQRLDLLPPADATQRPAESAQVRP
ncbi:MAG TPA: FAD-dependent monooxygenase [Actinocrinis sp.]|uniref:FAD-dependent monooxygenase n=1 Tax=Actinocrinis sp. TaxID=1920516 RepID=UPI002DDDA944|nr:FAD-dependent monooxygenase [Actinocrinis sp.]HEV3170697.1 FAD-dependent monooxygenase [Actinocrinis sp.]